MSIAARARPASLAGLGLVLAFASACPTRLQKTQERDALCASACAALRSCDAAPSRCGAECGALREQARSYACASEYDAYLACLSAGSAVCVGEVTRSEALAALGAAAACGEALARYQRCSAPCREHGVVRSGTRELVVAGEARRVQAEQRNLGCGTARPEPVRRSGAGAPCEAASVCSEARCPCPASPAATLARACVDGRCADAALSCRVVPLAVEYDPCRPAAKSAN